MCIQRSALASPFFSISPSEMPDSRCNQRSVLSHGLAVFMHIHMHQCEHGDVFSLCMRQLSLYFGLI